MSPPYRPGGFAFRYNSVLAHPVIMYSDDNTSHLENTSNHNHCIHTYPGSVYRRVDNVARTDSA